MICNVLILAIFSLASSLQCYQNKVFGPRKMIVRHRKIEWIEKDCKIIEEFELVDCSKFCLKINTNHGVLKTCGSNGGSFSKLPEDGCKKMVGKELHNRH